MNIGIDTRLIHETGVGRYIRNLLRYLSVLDGKNTYYIYTRSEAVGEVRSLFPKSIIRVSDVRWHTVKEQLLMPFIFGRDPLDLLHVPYFCIPVFYTGKLIITIHDMTPLHVKTGKASTLPFPLFLLKRLFYRFVISEGIRKAIAIIAVSKTTKKEILDLYPEEREKVHVVSEGVDESLLLYRGKKLDNSIHDPYILYVGNVYPHKNVMTAVRAFELAKSRIQKKINPHFVLVGKNDAFTQRLKMDPEVRKNGSLKFLTEVNDRMLAGLYTHASALIFPSEMEGFGLPAVEAIAFGCPVILSDIPIFRELFSDVGVFASPRDAHEFSLHIQKAIEKQMERIPLEIQSKYIAVYKWKEMASHILTLYEDSYRI